MVTTISARLTSVISTALLALVLLLATRRVLGFSGQAMLVLATVLSPFMVYKGTLAESEMTFTFAVTASLWAWFLLDEAGKKGFALWGHPAVLVAWSFMVKREPGLVFYYLSVYAYLIIRKRWREIFSVPQFAGMALTGGLIGLWMGYLMIQTSPAFVLSSYLGELSVHTQVIIPWVDLLKRYLSFPLGIFAYLLPFSLFLVPLGFKAIRSRLLKRYDNVYVFSACALVVNFPLYWLTTARTKYFMPMYPMLFILGAMVFETYLREPEHLTARVRWYFEKMTQGIYVLLAALALCLIILTIIPWSPEIPQPWIHRGVILAAGIALLTVAYYSSKSQESYRVCLLCISCLLLGIRILQFSSLLPFEEFKRLKFKNGLEAARSLAAQLPSGTRQVLVYGPDLRNAIYYYAKDIAFKRVSNSANELGESNWVVMDAKYYPGFGDRVSNYRERGRLFYEGHKMVLVQTGESAIK